MSGLGGLNKAPDGVVIGLVQLQNPVVVTKDDLARQTGKICAMVAKARRNLPAMDLVVFPEYALHGLSMDTNPEIMCTLDGPEVAAFKKACVDNKIWGCFSIMELNPGRMPFNSGIIIDELEFVTGKKVYPYVALDAALASVIEEAYGRKARGDVAARRRGQGRHAPHSGHGVPRLRVVHPARAGQQRRERPGVHAAALARPPRHPGDPGPRPARSIPRPLPLTSTRFEMCAPARHISNREMSRDQAEMLLVATAGHVDHGKSSLVLAGVTNAVRAGIGPAYPSRRARMQQRHGARPARLQHGDERRRRQQPPLLGVQNEAIDVACVGASGTNDANDAQHSVEPRRSIMLLVSLAWERRLIAPGRGCCGTC